MTNGEEVAADALAAGTMLFANTVTPDEWREMRARFGAFENVVVGFGMHPWWVGEQWALAEELEREAPDVIGEVGLDFGRRHAGTAELQLSVFETIARWAGEAGGKLLSLHSVHAAAETLEALERTGALESCRCVFHWFTGPSDLLKRAVLAGCYFSVGPRMVATGKGREYVKAIPVGQLLLETDAPPEQGQRYSYAELRAELETAADAIASIKGADALEIVEQTSRKLLGNDAREGS